MPGSQCRSTSHIVLIRAVVAECELKVPAGYRGDKSKLANYPAFLTAYLAAMAEPLTLKNPGEKRAAYGTVNWLVPVFRLAGGGRPLALWVSTESFAEISDTSTFHCFAAAATVAVFLQLAAAQPPSRVHS